MRPDIQHSFADALPSMVAPAHGEDNPDLRIVILNEPLALDLGLDPDWLRSVEGLRFLTARSSQTAYAQAYAGFQFGQFNPHMGDGRAALIGEIDAFKTKSNPSGVWDLHAKGIGKTAWSRPGSDGRGTLRSMLREYLMSEAMHALGVPTTRGLAVLSTGRTIQRTIVEPAGIHVRLAASHIRIGSYHYAALHGQLEALADYTITRHYPNLNHGDYRGLFDKTMAAQIRTVAAWQRLGFIHGVMNTDNTTLSGETIDYGPCAFMETFNPDTWFSSIDSQGRYRFGNQPHILGWNLTRLAESMLPLFSDAGSPPDAAITFAQSRVDSYRVAFEQEYFNQLSNALGCPPELVPGYLDTVVGKDLTQYNATLNEGGCGRGGDWEKQWKKTNPTTHFPRVIPRARSVEAALTNMAQFHRLLEAVIHPNKPNEDYEQPGNLDGYQTFCGT